MPQNITGIYPMQALSIENSVLLSLCTLEHTNKEQEAGSGGGELLQTHAVQLSKQLESERVFLLERIIYN